MMKLLTILCDQSRGQEMTNLLESHGVHGYTQIPMVHGSGITGKRMETRAWPGSGCLLFALIDNEKIAKLIPVLKKFKEQLLKSEGFMVFSSEAEVHL